MAKLAWRGSSVPVASLLACAAPGDFLSVVGSPGSFKFAVECALRTTWCSVPAFRRSGTAPVNWRTSGKQRNSICRIRRAACALGDGNPSASEGQGRNAKIVFHERTNACLNCVIKTPSAYVSSPDTTASPGGRAAVRHGPDPAESAHLRKPMFASCVTNGTVINARACTQTKGG